MGAIALREIVIAAKEVLFALLSQKLLGVRLKGRETMLIDEHRLHFEPLLPGGF